MSLCLNPVPTEQTTALTDLLLAATSAIAGVILWRRRQVRPLRSWVWLGMFASLMLAGLLGALAHGLELDGALRRKIWQPLNATLGLTVACFVTGAVLDLWGPSAARRSFPPLLLASAGFFVYATFLSNSFLSFVLYEGIAMLFCLVTYAMLAAKHRLPGAWWMTLGVLLTIAAAAVQATHAVRIKLLLPLDANGVFHLIQLCALGFLVAGLRPGMAECPVKQPSPVINEQPSHNHSPAISGRALPPGYGSDH